jgi:hypothetical protein
MDMGIWNRLVGEGCDGQLTDFNDSPIFGKSIPQYGFRPGAQAKARCCTLL